MVQYFMRILSSRMQNLNQEADLDHIKQLLIKKVMSKNKPNSMRTSVQQEALRFEELLTKFKRSNIVLKHTEVLHLLLQLSGDPSQQQLVNESNSGGVIDTVFNQKILNKLDYNA
mmetsp:Transcript_38671/g.37024  ORF Transcript_38671/g.37024 Transcript_38671/m.37024 type:complete len:115 (-) Transcript_38671:2280-2624(-)